MEAEQNQPDSGAAGPALVPGACATSAGQDIWASCEVYRPSGEGLLAADPTCRTPASPDRVSVGAFREHDPLVEPLEHDPPCHRQHQPGPFAARLARHRPMALIASEMPHLGADILPSSADRCPTERDVRHLLRRAVAQRPDDDAPRDSHISILGCAFRQQPLSIRDRVRAVCPPAMGGGGAVCACSCRGRHQTQRHHSAPLTKCGLEQLPGGTGNGAPGRQNPSRRCRFGISESMTASGLSLP